MLQELVNQVNESLIQQEMRIMIAITVSLIALIMLTYLVYRYRRWLRRLVMMLVYRLFIKPRLSSVIEPGNGRDEAFIGVLIGIVLAFALFAFMSIEIPVNIQYEAIGLLTSSGFSNYPTSLLIGQNITLYVLVYSHRLNPTWYVVNVYVNGTLIESEQRLMLMNEYYTFPVTLSFSRTGLYNVTASLYMISTNGDLTYTGRYVRLFVSVTG